MLELRVEQPLKLKPRLSCRLKHRWCKYLYFIWLKFHGNGPIVLSH